MPLGKFIKHKQQYQDKYTIEICVHRALNVTTTSSTPASSTYFIKYKRGGSHHGVSLRSIMDSNIVKFDNCSFSFPCTLYYNFPAKRDYEPKAVSLSLIEDVCDKGQKTLGEVKLNLAEFAKTAVEGKNFQLTETLVKRKLDPLKLQLTLAMKRTYDGGQITNNSPLENAAKISPSSTPPSSASFLAEGDVTPPRSFRPRRDSDSSRCAANSGTSTPCDLSSALSLPSDEWSGNCESCATTSSQGSPLSSSPTQTQSIPIPMPYRSQNSIGRRVSESTFNVEITRKFVPRQNQSCSCSPTEIGGLVDRVDLPRHRRTNSGVLDTHKGITQLKLNLKNGESEGVGDSVGSSDTTTEDGKLRAKVVAQEQELLLLKQELAIHQQQDDQRFFIDEILTFMKPEYSPITIPVSSYVIFRTLLQWGSFHPSQTRFLARLTEALDRLLVRHKTDSDVLLYWFSTTSSLLYLFRKELKVISAGNTTPNKSNTSGSGSCGGSGSGSGRSPPQPSSIKVFEAQLYSFASSFFTLYCNLIQEEISVEIKKLLIVAGDSKCEGLSCWDPSSIISIISTHSGRWNNSLPFESLREQILRKITKYIGGTLLNALLENGDGKKKLNLCRCGHAVGLKMFAVQIGEFLDNKIPWRSVLCKENISLIRQAADVLVVNKESLVQESVRGEICPSLSIPQIVCLLSSYSPDQFDSEPVHPGVISSLQAVHQTNNIDMIRSNNNSNSVLVDPLSGGGSDSGSGSGGEGLETYFTATSTCDFSKTTIPAALLARPGFSFLRVLCTDDSPW